MIATLQKESNISTARYERHFSHSVEDVWAMLTKNEKLQQWFSELTVVDLRKGGLIQFDKQDGTFMDMNILDYEPLKVLAFEWGNDVARFELSPESGGCKLIFSETISSFTEQTIKDLAGWHVCLDVVETLLDSRTVSSREESWKEWYQKYKKLIEEFN